MREKKLNIRFFYELMSLMAGSDSAQRHLDTYDNKHVIMVIAIFGIYHVTKCINYIYFTGKYPDHAKYAFLLSQVLRLDFLTSNHINK